MAWATALAASEGCGEGAAAIGEMVGERGRGGGGWTRRKDRILCFMLLG